MKAIIAETNGGYAAALLEDGRFLRIRNRGYKTGQRVDISPYSRPAQRWLAACAAFVIMLGLGSFGGSLWLSPYATVHIDINPSIELVLNRFYRVLSIAAANADAEDILALMDTGALRNATVEDAAEATAHALYGSAYCAGDAGNRLAITASAGSTADSDALAQTVSRAMQATEGTPDKLEFLAQGITQELAAQADAQSITPGQYLLSQAASKASEASSDADMENVLLSAETASVDENTAMPAVLAELLQTALSPLLPEPTATAVSVSMEDWWVPSEYEEEMTEAPTPTLAPTMTPVVIVLATQSIPPAAITASATASPTARPTAKATATASASTVTSKLSASDSLEPPPGMPDTAVQPGQVPQPGENVKPPALASTEPRPQPEEGMMSPMPERP